MQFHYKNSLSDFNTWSQKSHATDWLLFGKNLGRYLSLDETSLSNGELYTILTNKEARGKKGTIVAIVKGTKTEIVTDRFHVQKLASEAVQEQRVRLRWEIIEQENKTIEKSRKLGAVYKPKLFSNGDTKRQLLARSRYLLFKSRNRWTPAQVQRAEILFELYPSVEKAYELAQSLKYIFENNTNKDIARLKLAHWYNQVDQANFKSFNTIARSIQIHYKTILNYFNNRSTNASAESFNAKIKAFRAQFRGVRDVPFFLFRLTKIFA